MRRWQAGNRHVPATSGTRSIRFYALLAGGVIAGAFTAYAYLAGGGAGSPAQGHFLGLAVLLAIVLAVLFSALTFLAVRPLQAIVRHIEQLGANAGQPVIEAAGSRLPVAEVETVRERLNGFQSSLRELHRDLEKSGRKLRALANHDALTGARNRRAFDDYLIDLPELLRERRISMSFVLFDVYHLNAINETCGHQAGDEILRQVARRIGTVLRRGEHLFRVGGDEFAVIMLGTDESGARRFAERCLQELGAGDYSTLGVREPVKVCAGIACASFEDHASVTDLQWRADAAMASAKQPGATNIAVFRPDLAGSHTGVLSSRISGAVCEAITLGTGLAMFYQPVVDLVTGQILYYEALVRIRHRDEWITPAAILPVVEARHLQVDLDLAVLKRVLDDLRTGKVQRGSGVSINLSGPLVSDRNLVEWLAPFRPLLAEFRIVLEITETELITRLAVASGNLAELRAQGFEIALDDFGSSYSSFHYLATMPVDTVKFDISLVRGLGDESQRRIVEHLVAMLGELGHKLVAEGIEDEDTLESVRQAGFVQGQGYYFGHPAETAWRSDFDIDSAFLQTATASGYGTC